MQILKKISAKTVTGLTSAELAKLGRDKKTHLYSVMGKINETTLTVHDQYGESIGFKGTFEAQSLLDGSVSRALTFWPPQYIAQDIMTQLENAQHDDPNAELIVAYSFGVQPNDGSPTGYEYFVSPLHEPEALNDPFVELRKLLPKPESSAPLIEAKTKPESDAPLIEAKTKNK